MTRFLIRLELLAMFCFAVVAGACISYTSERRAHDAVEQAILHDISYDMEAVTLQRLKEINL